MMVPRLSGRAIETATVMPGFFSSVAELLLVVAGGREQQLYVGAGEPVAAAAEHLRAGDAEGQRAAPRRHPARDLADEPHAARELVDRDRIADAVGDADGVVIGEVGADAGKIVAHLDADRFQMRRRADAGDLQQVRRVDRAAGDDDLAARPQRAVGAVLAKRDARRSGGRRASSRVADALVSTRRLARPRASARNVRAVEPRKRPLRDICE